MNTSLSIMRRLDVAIAGYVYHVHVCLKVRGVMLTRHISREMSLSDGLHFVGKNCFGGNLMSLES